VGSGVDLSLTASDHFAAHGINLERKMEPRMDTMPEGQGLTMGTKSKGVINKARFILWMSEAFSINL
jgi:hypothetical protein